MTTRRTLLALCVLIASALLLSSCAGGRRQLGAVDEKATSLEKVVADAYLYDAKIHRHGKPTTIRLELYAVVDTVYVYGRAYLGKGALKARLTPDSLIALFPTEHEYLSDKIGEVMASGTCSNSEIGGLHLARLLNEPPLPDGMVGVRLSEGKKTSSRGNKTSIQLCPADSISCKWTLHLDYDNRAGRQVLVRLQFDDGSGTKLNAALREHKPHSRIPTARVTLDVPADYTRLSPR